MGRDEVLTESAHLRPRRLTFLGRWCAWLRTTGPWTVPPPRNCGARILPSLALPVPFCACGFLPPPLTSDLPFVRWVPCMNCFLNYLRHDRGTEAAHPHEGLLLNWHLLWQSCRCSRLKLSGPVKIIYWCKSSSARQHRWRHGLSRARLLCLISYWLQTAGCDTNPRIQVLTRMQEAGMAT